MQTEKRFHTPSDPDYYLHLIDRAKTEKTMTADDAKILHQFINQMQAVRGIKALRCSSIAQIMISWKQYLKPSWKIITTDNLHTAINALNKSKYKRNTKDIYIRVLKYFLTWLVKRGMSSISKDDLAEIRAPGIDSETTETKDLITPGELSAIIGGCLTHRDKALCATLHESAGRISEIARLRWGDLEYTSEGIIKLTIHDEKTKKKRYAPLLMSMEYLAAWRAGYPGKPSDDALIFIDRKGQGMTYPNMMYQIVRAAKRAGITKRITPHLFRKSRLTEMVREGYQESVIKEIGWANQSSQMLRTYIKLGSDDVMNEFLIRQGIKKREQKQKENVPRQCSYCFAMNSPISEFCHKCGQPMTEQARATLAEVKSRARADPTYLEIMARLERVETEFKKK
jgi:site-specific recombinase XerD